MAEALASKKDRRVLRTRRALRDALIALILERGWDGFGVQDLCERANVGRSTFYTHFADKEELVAGNFEDLRRMLRAQFAAEDESRGHPLAFARGLIQHAHEQRRLFLATVGKRSGQFVQRKFRDLVLDLVREDLSGIMPAAPRREAATAVIAGAFLELLTWSLEAKSPPSPEETDALFRELAGPVLVAATRAGAIARHGSR